MSTATTSARSANDIDHDRSRRSWDVLIASGVSALLVIVAGLALVLYPWDTFRRFDAEYLIPGVVGLAVLRGWGASGAALVTCLHVTAILHGRSRHASFLDGPPMSARRRATSALLAAGAVPILYLPVSALAMGSAMMTAYLGFGLRPAAFFHLLEVADVGYGLFTAVLMGAVPAVWTLAGRKFFSARERGLGFKLFVTWVFVVGLSMVVRIGTTVVEPREPDVSPSSGRE